MPIFQRRKNDYEKTAKTESVVKSSEKFSKSKADQFGGASSFGPHQKKRSDKSKSSEDKTYYLSSHNVIEYVGNEVLNQIGFNTPKTRITAEELRSRKTNEVYDVNYGVGSEAIPGYMPIAGFIESSDPKIKDSGILQNKKKFKLDMARQVVVDLETNQEFKVSGNLFAANIGAVLVNDKDFQPEQYNVGLVRRGDRYFAYLIDKDQIEFNGKNFQENLGTVDRKVIKSSIFNSATRDQQLYIINEIQKALENGHFKSIFSNKRITQSYNQINKPISELEKASNCAEVTAKSTVEYYLNLLNESNLDSFRERENWRDQLAEKVIEKLGLNISDEEKSALREIIKEDLRANYYQPLFSNKAQITKEDLNNAALIEKLVADQVKELSALKIYSPTNMLDQLLEFVANEKKRLESRGEKNKSHELQRLESRLKSDKEIFKSYAPQAKANIITKACKELDVICHHHTGVAVWRKATSEINWLAFKDQHKTILQGINPKIDVASPHYNQNFFSQGEKKDDANKDDNKDGPIHRSGGNKKL